MSQERDGGYNEVVTAPAGSGMGVLPSNTEQLIAQTAVYGVMGSSLLKKSKPTVGKPRPAAKLHARRLGKIAAKSRRRNRQ